MQSRSVFCVDFGTYGECLGSLCAIWCKMRAFYFCLALHFSVTLFSQSGSECAPGEDFEEQDIGVDGRDYMERVRSL